MTRLLPAIGTKQDYLAVYRDDGPWLPALRCICDRHGLPAEGLSRQVLGTHVVFRTGDLIVKLQCPLYLDSHDAEHLVLRHLRGLPSPELVAEGDLEGWPYLLMTVVPGAPAANVWPALSQTERADIIPQVGDLMRRLHAHAPIAELAIDWNRFLEERIRSAGEHHGVSGEWAGWLLRRLEGFAEGPFAPVLLHADITLDHVLLAKREGAWKVTGIIDFGDAMMGHPGYEFTAPLIGLAAGDAELARSLVESYGWRLDRELSERLLTYSLLHRYARLGDITERIGVGHPDGIFEAIWGGRERKES
jgi:hygromycin-B 7''-O-kinase